MTDLTPAERAAIETDLAKYAGMFGPHDPVTYARALLAALTEAEAQLAACLMVEADLTAIIDQEDQTPAEPVDDGGQQP